MINAEVFPRGPRLGVSVPEPGFPVFHKPNNYIIFFIFFFF